MNFFEFLKRYKYNSVLVKTFIIVIGLEIAMMAILNGVYFYRTEKSINREIEEHCISEVERQGKVLDTVLEQIISYSYYTTSGENNNSIIILTLDNVDEEDKEKELERLNAGVQNLKKSFEYVKSVYIYLEEVESVITESGIIRMEKFADKEWLEGYEEFKDRPYYMLKSRKSQYLSLLTVYYPVYRSGLYGEKIGSIIVNIDVNKLSEMLGFEYKDLRNIYMLSEGGELFYTNDKIARNDLNFRTQELMEKWNLGDSITSGVARWEEDGEESVTAIVKSSYGKWYYCMEFPMEYYGERFDETRAFMMWSAIVSILMGLVISIVLAIRTYRPIRYAIGVLESDETMVREILEDENNQNELYHIFELTHRIPRDGAGGSVNSEEWMERLGRAQMHVLQSQVTPHFLYNTLDAINWMAVERIGGKNEVSYAIQDLSQLLRKSMNQTSYFATLGEEMEQAKLYIRVMEIRDPGKLEVCWEIPEELCDRKVVRFTLQPILENAIRHGFYHRRFRGRITVKAVLIGEALVIQIIDDGCGMTREACKKMNDRLASEYEIVNRHVGIQNVNQRIKIMFGEDYGLRLVPGDPEGLIVYLAFPDMK